MNHIYESYIGFLIYHIYESYIDLPPPTANIGDRVVPASPAQA